MCPTSIRGLTLQQQQTHWVPPLTTRGDRWMSTSLPAPDKNKNMSLNGIRSQPWQQQSPPPQVDVKKSPLRSDWHTGRSWLTLSNIAFSPKRRKRKAASPVFLVMHFRLFPLKSTRWKRRSGRNEGGSEDCCCCCWGGGAVTWWGPFKSGEKTCLHTLLSKWETNQTTSEKCQSTGRVSFTSETLCLCTRKARWMASSVLWGMFLLSLSLSLRTDPVHMDINPRLSLAALTSHLSHSSLLFY